MRGIATLSPMHYVREFHQRFGLEYNRPLARESMNANKRELRISLIEEEVSEFAEAARANDIIEIADALADIVYVTYGAALVYGIELDSVLEEVHRSNMSKLGADGLPIYREDGKVLKSPTFSPPDIAMILDRL